MNILFICSGNTCRSPLAEGICEKYYGEKGVFAKSAGLWVYSAAPPAEHTLAILREIGIDKSQNRAQNVSQEIMDWCDRAYVMTYTQYEALRRRFPDCAGKVHILDDKYDIEDPFGARREAYDRCAAHIFSALRHRLGDL